MKGEQKMGQKIIRNMAPNFHKSRGININYRCTYFKNHITAKLWISKDKDKKTKRGRRNDHLKHTKRN